MREIDWPKFTRQISMAEWDFEPGFPGPTPKCQPLYHTWVSLLLQYLGFKESLEGIKYLQYF